MTETTDTTTTELPKAYRPADFEGAIYERWLAADVFAPDGAGSTGRPGRRRRSRSSSRRRTSPARSTSATPSGRRSRT